MERILEFLQEQNGDFSSKRLFAFLVVLSVVIDYQHAIWTGAVWNPSTMTIGLALGVVGFVAIGKKFEEVVDYSKKLDDTESRH